MSEQDLFVLADEDKDGSISGGEAVRFFSRSGLEKSVLRQASPGSAPCSPPHRPRCPPGFRRSGSWWPEAVQPLVVSSSLPRCA